MKFVFTGIAFFLLLTSAGPARAQLDSSYELLLGPSANTLTPSPLSTSPAPAKPAKRKPRNPASDSPAAKVEHAQATPTPAPTPTLPLPDALISQRSLGFKEEPSVAEQVHALATADAQKVMSYYQSQFDENDPRLNKLEIAFAPTLVNNESSSNYSYRNYSSVFTGVGLGANVWVTPSLGLGGNFTFSLGADTSGDPVTQTRTPIRYELLDTALKYRKFFGMTPTSKSLEFDLMYTDDSMIVPTDDLYRAGLKTSGLGLKMTVRIPSSADVAWLFGGSFFPKLQHEELATGVAVSSGSNTDNNRIGVQLGTEMKLARDSQVFAEVSATYERNVFSGPASLPDPATGTTPTNVNVSDTFYMFSFGYRWGN